MICRTCGVDKPLSDYYSEKRTKLGYRPHCKSCILSKQKKYTEGKSPQKNKPNAQRTQYSRDWDKRNPEKAKARQKKHYETKRKFVPRDPEYTRAYVEARRVRKAGAEGSHTVEEWLNLCVKYGNKCIYPECENTDLTEDHVISLSKGGTHNIDNIQPLCRSHNCKKWTNTDDYRYEICEA